MQLDKQKTGKPSKQPYSTSCEGIGNTGTSIYEEVMAGRVVQVEKHPCNNLPIPKPTCESGIKQSISALGVKL